MPLFNYSYHLHSNGDLIVSREFNHENNHILSKIDREKPRNFQLNYAKYRMLSSAAIWLLKSAKNKVIFLTFTFNANLKLNESQTNDIWNRFIKNFRQTYGCKNYVGTMERTKIGTPHYHVLMDFPFVRIGVIDAYWKGVITDYVNSIDRGRINCIVGSVQLPKDAPTVIDHSDNVVRYICKYFTKAYRAKYSTKCYFISSECRRNSAPIKLTLEQMHIIDSNLTPVASRKFEHCHVLCYRSTDIDLLAQILFDSNA